jgi:GWxTD domain-containing protein
MAGLAALAALLFAAILLTGLAGCSAASGGGIAAMAELTNPSLGPDDSDWLVGPVARLATPDEIKAYLALQDDRAAAAFIQQFWERRRPGKGAAHAPPPVDEALFEERSAVADKKFSEAGFLGRRTDRGTIFVLYGQPKKGGFEVAAEPNLGSVEVWEYAADAPVGLDGKRPDRTYRFVKRGDLTVFYVRRVEPQRHVLGPGTPP